MIDLHCHILPCVDDGAKDIAEALKMAQSAVADGVTKIVATPHSAACEEGSFSLCAKVANFNTLLRQHGLDLHVYPSYECHHSCELLLGGKGLFPGGRYSLVELPSRLTDGSACEILFEILATGVTPVLAHPERNHTFRHDHRTLFELVDHGVLLQLTAGSLLGEFGADVKAFSRFLLKEGKISFLASDGHSATFRPPVLSKAVKAAAKIIGKEHALRLVHDNPQAVLAGEPVV